MTKWSLYEKYRVGFNIGKPIDVIQNKLKKKKASQKMQKKDLTNLICILGKNSQ